MTNLIFLHHESIFFSHTNRPNQWSKFLWIYMPFEFMRDLSETRSGEEYDPLEICSFLFLSPTGQVIIFWYISDI